MAKNPWLQLRTEFFFAIHPKTPMDLFLRIFFLISAAVSLWKNGLSHGLVQGSSSIASNKLNANITALGLS